MNKVMDIQEAVQAVKSGSTLMIGGFNVSGVPSELVEAVSEYTDATELTTINIDTGVNDSELYKLMKKDRIKKVIATYFGVNKETESRINRGILEYELVPQGTFAERIRAAGAGLGGILTAVGVGTIVEEKKQKVTIDGKEYLIELPIKADVALIRAEIADESGNLYLIGTARNTNVIMATAADYVIAQSSKIVPVGALDPNMITVPSIYVDAVVKVGE